MTKFPSIVALIAPQVTTDLPSQFTIEAVSGQDHLHCCIIPEGVAQIIVPNETDLGETIINEVIGDIYTEGQLKGESVKIEGKGS